MECTGFKICRSTFPSKGYPSQQRVLARMRVSGQDKSFSPSYRNSSRANRPPIAVRMNATIFRFVIFADGGTVSPARFHPRKGGDMACIRGP